MRQGYVPKVGFLQVGSPCSSPAREQLPMFPPCLVTAGAVQAEAVPEGAPGPLLCLPH